MASSPKNSILYNPCCKWFINTSHSPKTSKSNWHSVEIFIFDFFQAHKGHFYHTLPKNLNFSHQKTQNALIFFYTTVFGHEEHESERFSAIWNFPCDVQKYI